MMEKFDFMIGSWELDYQIPKTSYSAAETGRGTGIFSRELNNKYVFFNYSGQVKKAIIPRNAINVVLLVQILWV